MKIQIREKEHAFQISVPTGLIFSRFFLRMLLKNVRVNENEIRSLSPEAVDRLSGELRHIKKKHGSWELVEIQSSGGELVKIIL